METVSPAGNIGLGRIGEILKTDQAASTGEDFGTFLKQAAAETVGTIRSGETAMRDGLSGKAGPQEVVNAILAAETTLQTVVAIREKAVNAYNELLRMQV